MGDRVTGNTGLLTERCDPYGAESTIKLMGGIFPETQAGKYHWYCPERAESRFRFYCKGGDYGFRRQNDGGLIQAYHCPGGHKGPVMPLCRIHQRELAVGPPQPGYTADKKTPYGQIGGTKANEMCPACAAPPEARTLMDRANVLHQEMSRYVVVGLAMSGPFLRMQSEADQISAELNEMNERGIVHKCPLILREIS